MNQPKPNQHYRLSLEKAKKDYEDGIITATGLVYYAVGIYRKPGQKLRVKDIDAFCSEIGINRATFYRAISKLKAKNRLEWEAIAGVDLWIPLEPNVIQHPTAESQTEQEISQNCETLLQMSENLSQICETSSQDSETLLQTCENLSQLGDGQPEKPSCCKDSSIPSNIYQSFLNFLSIDQRERFKKFCKKAISQLPHRPVLEESWLNEHHQELWRQYQKQQVINQATEQAIAESMQPEPEPPPLNPIIQAGLDSGEIRNLDLPFKGLWDALGNWWKQSEWIEKHWQLQEVRV